MSVGSETIDAAGKLAPMRPAAVAMDLERLGSLYPYKYSFMRMLLRRAMNERWRITQSEFELDDDGIGHAVYEVKTSNAHFSFVAFSHYLDPDSRCDRVIAEAWDMTATLCEGSVDDKRLEFLRANVPLQEKGRLDANCIVLSRANKSARNFQYVVDCLAKGEQPVWNTIARVGYLYRTTAVYGSGKFGMADWRKVAAKYEDFASAFSAEMFSCFMIRQFSFDLADHVARARGGARAASLDDTVKRYMGIGNATGLGMAPYLINHPLLISYWVEMRETALASAAASAFNEERLNKFRALIKRARQHLSEIATDNEEQNATNENTRDELEKFAVWLQKNEASLNDWAGMLAHAEHLLCVDAQELINTLLIELCGALFAYDDRAPDVIEDYSIDASMKLEELKVLIEDAYDWALHYDFRNDSARGVFWYRSEEKMEPRLGRRNEEAGEDREMLIGVAYAVRRCHDDIGHAGPTDTVGEFVVAHPQHRLIVRRIQTMARTAYGDIRANLLDREVLPIQLLRCKLSFFGVSKFDPRSKLWVRNTMFQGAPTASDIGQDFDDDWCFPIMPQTGEQR